MISIHLIQFNENRKPKATANHMNIQTYNSVTELLHQSHCSHLLPQFEFGKPALTETTPN